MARLLQFHLPANRGTSVNPSESAPALSRIGDGLKAFVVDDEPAVLSVTERVLAEMGFDVDAALSGEEALSFLKTSSAPALILSDLHMPGMSGDELLRQVRELHDGVATILSSGHMMDDVAVRDNNTVHLRKPYRVEQLRKAVQAALATKRCSGASIG